MHKKLPYLAPEADTLVVQSEGVICASGDFLINGFQEEEGALGGIMILPESLL